MRVLFVSRIFLLACLCITFTSFSGEYPNEEHNLMDFFPLGPEHSYKMVVSYDSYSFSEWCMEFSKVDADGICKCKERRGDIVGFSFFKRGKEGIFRSVKKEALIKNKACLFLPAVAKVHDKWIYKDDGRAYQMSLVGSLGNVSMNSDEFPIIQTKLMADPSGPTIEYVLAKKVGTISIKVISDSPSCPKVGMGFRNEFLFDAINYRIK